MDAQSTERTEGPSQSSTPDRASREWRAFRRGHGTTDGPQPRARGGTLIELGMEETLHRSEHRRDEEGRLNCVAVASFLSKGGSTIQFGSSCFDERGGRIGLVCEKWRGRSKDFILTENFSPHSSPRPQAASSHARKYRRQRQRRKERRRRRLPLSLQHR